MKLLKALLLCFAFNSAVADERFVIPQEHKVAISPEQYTMIFDSLVSCGSWFMTLRDYNTAVLVGAAAWIWIHAHTAPGKETEALTMYNAETIRVNELFLAADGMSEMDTARLNVVCNVFVDLVEPTVAPMMPAAIADLAARGIE